MTTKIKLTDPQRKMLETAITAEDGIAYAGLQAGKRTAYKLAELGLGSTSFSGCLIFHVNDEGRRVGTELGLDIDGKRFEITYVNKHRTAKTVGAARFEKSSAFVPVLSLEVGEIAPNRYRSAGIAQIKRVA
jgi:hypothetical protein